MLYKDVYKDMGPHLPLALSLMLVITRFSLTNRHVYATASARFEEGVVLGVFSGAGYNSYDTVTNFNKETAAVL